MRWLRRKQRERDLEREIRADLELEVAERRKAACRQKTPSTPPAALLVTRHWSGRMFANCGDGPRSIARSRTYAMPRGCCARARYSAPWQSFHWPWALEQTRPFSG